MGLLHWISFLLSFILLSTAFNNSVEGRSLFRFLEIPSERGEQTKVRTLIGSRPPMCERSCRACGHCEAVQVPVIPQALNKDRSKKLQASASDSRGDMSSNYKPLSWKCKCGNLIFNP
ncbi:EPIDERMAL PATTERNING FACTOR-like protein 2 [Zingiber officinale]|uniref:EPIDERMAL PATTERNING FACTOR-like protein 2 n=1 Tax=Zingiber officinale TaxID=94328 RepID=UPI001C4C7D25|nr:EPIDERMAL PATTERNING FACTOR-like protein 2 [Zingiber officinale]